MEDDVLGRHYDAPDDGYIIGGAGFGLIVASADGEVASPVNWRSCG